MPQSTGDLLRIRGMAARGARLASATIAALMWEARNFLRWQFDRGGAGSLQTLSVVDVDLYMDMRAPGLRRKSLADVAERLRSVVRYLHRTGASRPISRRTSSAPCSMPTKMCPRRWTTSKSPQCWRQRGWTNRRGDYAIMRYFSCLPHMGCAKVRSAAFGSKT
jgi:hypothetical protein